MAHISSNTRCAADVVEVEPLDVGVELEEEGERLADTSASAEDGDVGVACGGGGKLADRELAGCAAGEHGERRGGERRRRR